MEKSSLSAEQEAISLVRELNSIELPKFRVIGGIVRYEQSARNSMKDTKQKIVASLTSQPFGIDNYLLWAPPGSGKSFFIQEVAKSLGDSIEYREINLAQKNETEFRNELAELERLEKPPLCLIDEVDSKPAEPWPYEALLPFLEPPSRKKSPRTCYVLAGSSGVSIMEMKAAMRKRPKGVDLLSRIPPRNEFIIEGLGLGDRLLVASTQFLNAAQEYGRHIDEVEKLVLFYVATNPRLESARQIRQLAVQCVERIPKGEERIKFDYLFDAGDSENKEFWLGVGPLRKEFVNAFVRLEDNRSPLNATNSRSDEKLSVREPASGRNRIAVLPFTNISPDPNDEYLAEGMTEELISSISKIHGLRVISRTSVMRYKETTKSIGEIGQELQVRSLLEGSVRKVGNRLRIAVQLIEAETDEHLWSETYDREFQDVFAIQSEISTSVAKALEVRLVANEKERIERAPTENLEAYTLYLKGRFHFNRLVDRELETAIEYFELAVQEDPNYSLALTGLADSYWHLGTWVNLPKEQTLQKAKQFATKALEKDGSLAEVHLSMALVNVNYDWDIKSAEKEFRRAIELNPSLARAYAYHSYTSIVMGDPERFDEMVLEAKHAIELDRMSTEILTVAGTALMYAHRYDEAVEKFGQAIAIDDNNVALAHDNLGLSLVRRGEIDRGISEIRKAIKITRHKDLFQFVDLAYAYMMMGNYDEVRKMFEEAKVIDDWRHAYSSTAAFFYAILGENERAFKWMEKALEERSVSMFFASRNGIFMFDNIRSDPRYQKLLIKAGLLNE